MKRIVKALYALLVGIIVFTGALYIFAGARERASWPQSRVQEAETPSAIRTEPFSDQKGSAL